MTEEINILHCEFCTTDAGFIEECYFCKKPVCTKDAHFITVPEESIKGTYNKTIRVCPECKPKY